MSDSTSTDNKELNNGELNHPQNSGDEGDIPPLWKSMNAILH